jgi:hypothetical protein
MRIFLIVFWVFVPLALGAYHYGPGQEQMVLDEAASFIRDAKTAVDGEEWAQAVAAYDEALSLLPPERKAERWRLQLEKAKAQMQCSKLPTAHDALVTLLETVEGDPAADAQLKADTRLALANAQYYMTWLLRLEGQPRTVWEPEIDAARQNYRLLAEKAVGKAQAERKEDLEASVKLSRLDLTELQGLPLPSQ